MFNAKLISLMVLMVVLAAGSALAGGDFVTYGKVHLSVDMFNDSENSEIVLSSNSSRFGLKGNSAMNDDFTMFWQFENDINIADMGGFLATRNSFMGVKHEMGSVLFGIHDTPYKTLGRKATFFHDQIGDNRQTMMGWDNRPNDVVMLTTKDIQGFKASAMYQLDQNALGALEAANTFSFNGLYKKDKFFFGAAVEMVTMGNFGMAGDYDGNIATVETWEVGKYNADGDTLLSSYVPESAMGIRAGFTYTDEKFAVAGTFQTLSNIAGEKDAAAMTFGGEGKYFIKEHCAFKVGYYMADPDTDNENDEYALLALGIDRSFGKDKYVYIQYGMVMNGDASDAGLNGGGHGNGIAASADGKSPTGISVGMCKGF